MMSIRNELKRLEEASRSDYEIALINERATRASLDAQFLRTADVGRSQVKLQGLDSAATTAELAYEEALKRYTETVQKESFPMVQARIVARAVPPDEKFKPKTVLLVAVGTVGGLVRQPRLRAGVRAVRQARLFPPAGRARGRRGPAWACFP